METTNLIMGKSHIDDAVQLWVRERFGGKVMSVHVDKERGVIEVEAEMPPPTWCGMRHHHFSCECDGSAGGR